MPKSEPFLFLCLRHPCDHIYERDCDQTCRTPPDDYVDTQVAPAPAERENG